jgi:phage recombination protein Bet
MSTALAIVGAPASIDTSAFFSGDQVALIKRQIAKDCSDDELKLFLYQCARTGLDPFSRQIYAIVRKQWNPETREKEPKMTIQTGIDGLRLIAERTKRYAPGPEPVFEYDAAKKIRKATAYVKKRTDPDGTWHMVEASAYYDEYVQLYNGQPQGQWSKPHMMLGKCAEALALRKAFPAEMSGIYTGDEIQEVSAEPIDPGHGKGSGPNGRIVKADVDAAFEAGRVPCSTCGGKTEFIGKGLYECIANRTGKCVAPKAGASAAAADSVPSTALASGPASAATLPGSVTSAGGAGLSPKAPTAPSASSSAEPAAGVTADADGVVADEHDPKPGEFRDLVEVWAWRKTGGTKKAGNETGEWVSTGTHPQRSLAQNAKLHALRGELKITDDEWRQKLTQYFYKDSSAELSVEEARVLIDKLERRKEVEAGKRTRQERRFEQSQGELEAYVGRLPGEEG